MKIAVIGLGIIGGSLCASFTKIGYKVYGYDLDEKNVEMAIERGYIVEKAKDFSLYDVIFIAVPPKATISILENTTFKENALVMDICGVKKAIEDVVYAKDRNYRYLGLHPMAGKETSGLSSASDTLFQNANLVVTVSSKTDGSAILEGKKLAKELGFGVIIECTAEEHDKKIALTSQLAHLVSNAYVKSPEVSGCEPFTGGSFQDMTRIAGVDEKIWSQLYLFNRENIVEELDLLIAHLQEYRDAIDGANEREISDCLKTGRLIREKIKRKNT